MLWLSVSLYDDFCSQFQDVFKSDSEERDTGLPLHYTTLHENYLKEFARTVEWVLKVNKEDEDDFYRECKQTLAGNPPSTFDADKHEWFLDAMMAALDFRCFLKHMRKKANSAKSKGKWMRKTSMPQASAVDV